MKITWSSAQLFAIPTSSIPPGFQDSPPKIRVSINHWRFPFRHRGTPSPHPDGIISRSQKPSSDLGGTPIDGNNHFCSFRPAKIHHFNGIFPNKNHPFWVPPLMETTISVHPHVSDAFLSYPGPPDGFRHGIHWASASAAHSRSTGDIHLPLVTTGYHWLPLGCNYYGSCMIYIYIYTYIYIYILMSISGDFLRGNLRHSDIPHDACFTKKNGVINDLRNLKILWRNIFGMFQCFGMLVEAGYTN